MAAYLYHCSSARLRLAVSHYTGYTHREFDVLDRRYSDVLQSSLTRFFFWVLIVQYLFVSADVMFVGANISLTDTGWLDKRGE